nr:alpha/beta hydrolases superfamily protein [Tanacetum cinerariifolium]
MKNCQQKQNTLAVGMTIPNNLSCISCVVCYVYHMCMIALDEGFSSKNYVRKYLRDLHPKWRAKVTAIEELKDLSSLALDELIENLKKESSDDKTSTSRSDDDEYAMAIRNLKNFFRRKGKFVRQPREERKSLQKRDEKKGKSDWKCFRCGDPSHLIGDYPKTSRNKDQKAFIGGSWSDIENTAKDKTNDETYLMAQSSNEVCLRTCLEPDLWIKYSGCSKHMTGKKNLFSTYKAYDGDGVFFNQSKYIKEMLKKFGLEDSKTTKILMSTEIKLAKDDEADSMDSSKYRDNPKNTHLEAIKHIFRTCELVLRENVYSAKRNRDHTQAVIALILYCLENRQPFNLAYFIVRRMYFFRDTRDKVLPYGMILTYLFENLKANMAQESFDERYKLFPRKMSPIKAKQPKRPPPKELGITNISPRSYHKALKDDPNMFEEQRETRRMFKNLGRALQNFARMLKKDVIEE